MNDRCSDQPWCVRYPYHEGECRRWRNKEQCDYLLPLVGELCARTKGHSTRGLGKGHRSRHTLDYEAQSRRKFGDLEAA